MTRWLTRAGWEQELSADAPPIDPAGLRKVYLPDSVERVAPSEDADDDARQRPVYRFTLSTAAIDRERDTVRVEGWKLSAYRRNPVVLWAHDYRLPPLGQSVELPKAKDGKLVAGVRFDSDVSELARVVAALVDRGTLRACSVGFRPLKHVRNDERMGYDFEEQELLEWSIVPVPANPEALAEAKHAGVDLAPLRQWAEAMLEGEIGAGFWIARSTLEGIWTTLAQSVSRRAASPGVGHPVPSPVEAVTRTDGLRESRDDVGVVRFWLDDATEATEGIRDADVSADEVREIVAALATEAAERVVLRLTGRVD